MLGIAPEALRKAHAEQAGPRRGLVQRVGERAAGLPRGEIGFNLASDEIPDAGAPASMDVGHERRWRPQTVEIEGREGSCRLLHGSGPIDSRVRVSTV